MHLKNKLIVPAVWKELLDIEQFLPGTPKARGEIVVDAPTPYRDDSREVNMIDGDYLVILNLCSGNNNYWLSYQVQKKQPGDIDFKNADVVYEFNEEFFDLSDKDDLTFNGETISFDIELSGVLVLRNKD